MGKIYPFKKLIRNREPVPLDEFEHKLWDFEPVLSGFAYRLTKDYHDAEDLLQETIVKTLEAKDKYNSGQIQTDKFGSYVFMIMRNTFYDACNGNYRHIYPTDKFHAEQIDDMEIEATSTLGDFMVTAAMEKIPDIYKDVLKLKLDGYKEREIQEMLNINSINIVKSRFHRGRSLIRKILTGEYNVDSDFDRRFAKTLRVYDGLTQHGLVRDMGIVDNVDSAANLISAFEKGKRTPGNPPTGHVSRRYVTWLKGHGYNPFQL